LPVREDRLAAVAERYRSQARPWIVLGIGAFHAGRDWPDDYWAQFLVGLRGLTAGTIFLIGGADNALRAQRLIAENPAARIVNGCDLALGDALALLRHADLFVGTDSGALNLAAAVGTTAFGLFGVNRALDYSRFIEPISPEGGQSPDGMLRIAPAQVLERVKAALARREA